MNIVVRLPAQTGDVLAELVAEERADIARMATAFREDGLSFRLDLAYFDAEGKNVYVPVENAAGYYAEELHEYFHNMGALPR